MLFVLLSKQVLRHRELPDSSEFPNRMCGKRWRVTQRNGEKRVLGRFDLYQCGF
jgi:hypothetical protein